MANFQTIPDLGLGNPKLSVRPAVTSDVPVISRVQGAAIVATVAAVLGEDAGIEVQKNISTKDIEKSWEQALQLPTTESRGLLTAVEGDTPVGFAAFAVGDEEHNDQEQDNEFLETLLKSAQILAFEITAQKQREGHGSRLLSAIADHVKEAGAPGMATWIVGEDAARVKFFQEAGFAPAGPRRTLDTGAGQVTEHLWFTLF